LNHYGSTKVQRHVLYDDFPRFFRFLLFPAPAPRRRRARLHRGGRRMNRASVETSFSRSGAVPAENRSDAPVPVVQAVPEVPANRKPISDYGFIGDMRGAALVGRDASIDWLCLGRFDAAPTFFGLLDAQKGGRCSVTLAGAPLDPTRRYLPDTNILETTLLTDRATITVTDFMPVRKRQGCGDTGPDSDAPGVLARIVRCVDGAADVTLQISPRLDWGRARAAPMVDGRTVRFADDDLRLESSHRMRAGGDADAVEPVQLSARLGAGESLTLVIGPERGQSDDIGAWVDEQFEATLRYWTDWSALCAYRGFHAGHVLRSALCLKLLTYAPTGALIAAPTVGLPEAVGGERNWDYRFVWTRDASFSVSAFLNLGLYREAAEFLRFLQQADSGGEVVRVMYGIDGPVLPEENLDFLAGWRDSRPVSIGNGAEDQKQHEIYGELLAALNLYVANHGLDGLCPSLKDDLPHAVTRLAQAAIDTWRLPDQGIWELRGPARHLLHTKGMCWVALDRAIKLAPRLGMTAPSHWARQRDDIREECLARCWNEGVGALSMEFDGADLDMSTLRLSLMGFIDAKDARMQSTLEASIRQLGATAGAGSAGAATGAGDGRPDLFYRYVFDDGLPGREGTFTACSFWVAGMMTLCGRHDDARRLLDSVLARSNDLGLFSEEFDPATGEQLGNFPQGFTHMAIIHEITRLQQALDIQPAKGNQPKEKQA
jgi:GH15 family glucan-1,4-alpha-glucosidase